MALLYILQKQNATRASPGSPLEERPNAFAETRRDRREQHERDEHGHERYFRGRSPDERDHRPCVAELGATRGARRSFERPVDSEALVVAVAEIAEPARRGLRGTSPPPSYQPRRETARPARAESESGFPGPDAELGGILPNIEDEA